MYVQLKYKKVKIKKSRKCWGCCTLHDVGDKMNYSVGVIDGEILSTYWCEICKLFLQSYDYGEDLDYGYGDLKSELSYILFKKSLTPKREIILEKTNNTKLYKILKRLNNRQ